MGEVIPLYEHVALCLECDCDVWVILLDKDHKIDGYRCADCGVMMERDEVESE